MFFGVWFCMLRLCFNGVPEASEHYIHSMPDFAGFTL